MIILHLTKREKHYLENGAIQLLFIAIAISFSIIFIIEKRIPAIHDVEYNFQRACEIFTQLLHFHFPRFNLNTSLPYGVAIPTMYPWLCLAPFVILKIFIHNPVDLWSVLLSFIMLIGLEISYGLYYHYAHKKLSALCFSVAYCLSTLEIVWAGSNADLGYYISTLVAPIAFFGWIYWIRQGKWRMMTLGLLLMLFSHILDTLVMIVSLIILTLCFWAKTHHKLQKFGQLCKAGLVFLIASSIVWVPILIIMFHNQIAFPASVFDYSRTPTIIPKKWIFLLEPATFQIWTYTDLVSLVLAIIYWKHIPSTIKKFIYIAIVYILLNQRDLNYFLIKHTIFSHIQFMFRICFVSHLLLTFVFAYLISKILVKRWYIQNLASLLLVLFLIMDGSIFLNDLEAMHVSRRPVNITHIIRQTNAFSYKRDVHVSYKLNFIQSNDANLKKREYWYYCSHNDYLPEATAQNYQFINNGIASGHHSLRVYPHSDGKISFNLKQSAKSVLVPITMYRPQKYAVTLNHHATKWSFNKKYGFVRLHNLPKGHYTVQLHIEPMKSQQLIECISLIGAILLIPYPNIEEPFDKEIEKRKKQNNENN